MFCINFEINVAPSGGPAVLLNLAFEIALTDYQNHCKHTPQNAHYESWLVDLVRNMVENNPDAFELCKEGVGGTYFVKDTSGTRVAIFKPMDEEPGASGNPKKLVVSPILPSGGGAQREVAAYVIDKGRAGVPETTMLTNLRHSHWSAGKTGSLQKYIPHKTVAADMGSSLFSVENVHNIGILDIRLLNLDRNGENILVVDEGTQDLRLVPIDHSYILPPRIMSPVFEWQFWKQSKVPFSEETLKFITSIDMEEDAKALRSVGLSEECIRTMRVTTTLLKRGACHQLNLFQIASLMCAGEGGKSDLALVVEKAESLSGGGDESLFYTVYEKLVEELVCRNSL